jgi:hypothetical protein
VETENGAATTAAVLVGQIRSIKFINEEGLSDSRFVLVTAISDSDLVQVMLIGSFHFAGKNDVLLYEDEKPSLEADAIQTDLRFPVLRANLGHVYSAISSETRELLYKMLNFSGRDISRKGLMDQSNWMRQDYFREEMNAMMQIAQIKKGE